MILLHGLAARWLTDESPPGMVEIRFDDADGRTHRFVESSTNVDSARTLHAGADYPIAVGFTCQPHHHPYRPDTDDRINSVDLSPRKVSEHGVRRWVRPQRASRGRGPGALYPVNRKSLTWAPPATYSDLSVAARQAAALVTFRRWRTATAINAPELDALEQHLWRFTTVVPDTFDAWYESDVLDPSEPLPARLASAIEAAGLNPDEVRPAIEALVDITYGGLFGGIESQWSLKELNAVVGFALRQGITPAPADPFIDSLWIDDDWGRPNETIVRKWRAID